MTTNSVTTTMRSYFPELMEFKLIHYYHNFHHQRSQPYSKEQKSFDIQGIYVYTPNNWAMENISPDELKEKTPLKWGFTA